jgi:hypothetical protein
MSRMKTSELASNLTGNRTNVMISRPYRFFLHLDLFDYLGLENFQIAMGK